MQNDRDRSNDGRASIWEWFESEVRPRLIRDFARLSADDANDLAQEVTLRTFAHFAGNEPGGEDLQRLAAKIAHDLRVDWLRRRGREIPLDGVSPDGLRDTLPSDRTRLLDRISELREHAGPEGR